MWLMRRWRRFNGQAISRRERATTTVKIAMISRETVG
jgi:hypothetical protein